MLKVLEERKKKQNHKHGTFEPR